MNSPKTDPLKSGNNDTLLTPSPKISFRIFLLQNTGTLIAKGSSSESIIAFSSHVSLV